MDSAITKTGEVVRAIMLDEKDLKYRSQYKGELYCPTCHQQMFFRKSSKDGKKACMFGTHKPDCKKSLNTPAKTVNQAEAIDYVKKILVDNSRIKIKLPKVGELTHIKPTSTPQKNTTNNQKIRQVHHSTSSQSRVAEYTLKEILKWLIYTDFSRSDKEIDMGDGFILPANRMFSNIATLNLENNYWVNGTWKNGKKRWRTKWLFGTLSAPYLDNFFYFEGTDTALLLGETDKNSLKFTPYLGDFSKDYEKLNGCHILLKAEVFQAQDSNKWYLRKHFRDNYLIATILDPIHQ